mmetsp:Transcript_79999/g.175496  ORF Transcript_79999/g.175496 Transcript_79999/m.175496 type:complete len:427 (+) Transcript_79999:90-1370(+)
MSGFSWVPFNKGDDLPGDAIFVGETSTDGPNYVCRVNGEAGKVNAKDGKVNNFWCNNGGKSESGEILCLEDDYEARWMYKKSRDPLPAGAVCAGSTKTDGDNYVGRLNGAGCKVNLDSGNIWKWWVHAGWFETSSSKDGDVLSIVHRSTPASSPAEQPQHSAPAAAPATPAVRPPGAWNPAVMCDGISAGDRAKWLMENQGLSDIAAENRVMGEFPDLFKGRWNPDVMCDGSKADDRAKWLMDNKGMSHDEAKAQVMQEFPSCFNDWWVATMDCEGVSAGDRAKWLMENEGYSESAAKFKVKEEFPNQLHGPGSFIGGGKFPHALSLTETPEGPRLKIEVVCNTSDVGLVAVHYQINGGQPMNFDIRHPVEGSKTYCHVTPGGGYPICRPGDEVSYWLAAEIKGLITEDPAGACPKPNARFHWTAH